MTLTVSDNRTTIDEADSLTGWSNPSGSSGISLVTSNPSPVELTGCIGQGVSTETSDIVHAFGATDLTSTLIYVWVLPLGQMDTVSNGGVGLVLGDGTDLIGYHLAGSDGAAFRHNSGPVAWQCLLVDTSTLPLSFTVQSGVEANLTVAALTQIGAIYSTLSKALGGGDNCYTDVIRTGNGGLTITAGTSGSPGLFSEIVAEDLSDVNTQAYGIIRELGANLFGMQGALVFGDSAGTAATFFADTNGVAQFEDRGIGTDKYSITVQGNATGSTTFRLGLPAGATGGTDGFSIIVPLGVGGTFDATDTELDFLLLYGSTLSGFTGGILLSVDATNAPNHEVFACLLSGNGQITPGLVEFKNNRIVGAIPVLSTEAALLFPTSDTDIDTLAFQIGVDGHAIRHDATGTFDYRDILFSGYSASSSGAKFNTSTGVAGGTEVITTDAVHGFVTEEPVILNDDGGAVTVGLTEGTVYYVRALTTTTLSFHTSPADALSDTARVNLTAGASETQSLYSGNAAVINDSGGLVTINVSGGGTPSYRNVGASTTVPVNVVTLTVRVSDVEGNLLSNVGVGIYTDDPVRDELMNEDTVAGIATESFSYLADQGITIRVRESPNTPTGRFIPFFSRGTITVDGFSLDVILQDDPIASVT